MSRWLIKCFFKIKCQQGGNTAVEVNRVCNRVCSCVPGVCYYLRSPS